MYNSSMELRLYSFVNFYLSSIQQGIQTGHCAVDLVRKYANAVHAMDVKPCDMVAEWADKHKTFIILNGGDFDGIMAASKVVEESGYPFAFFHESAGALAGVRTCVSVVLPENLFNARIAPDTNPFGTTYAAEYYVWYDEKKSPGSREIYVPGFRGYDILKFMKGCGLAR
jgi:hypothetical protein